MNIKITSAVRQGLNIIPVEVECQSVQGKPGLIIIGLAAKALAEASERLTNALNCCGLRLKTRKTILNLAPASIHKKDSALELAMAVALYLVTTEETWDTTSTAFFGELSLTGDIRPVSGVISLVLAAKERGLKQVFIPAANRGEVEIITGIEIYPISHLKEVLTHFHGQKVTPIAVKQYCAVTPAKITPLLTDVIGQNVAKRCLEIAAAGGHNVLFTGVPGSGKSMLAAGLASILPPLTEPEAIALTKIYSASGQLPANSLITTRPFRAPHHSISTVGLVGGGQSLSPGEISLAHHGILFLDELAEFRRDALEALRQPLENGTAIITRAHGQAIYPAAFTLIAATNPCPCGHFGSGKQLCTCSLSARENYAKRLSGPILDRIDLNIFVNEVAPHELTTKNQPAHANESLEIIKKRILLARQRQAKRLEKYNLLTNSRLSSPQIRECLTLSKEAGALLQTAASKMNISARSYFKIIKIARTIADLDTQEREEINANDIAEALQYRNKQA